MTCDRSTFALFFFFPTSFTVILRFLISENVLPTKAEPEVRLRLGYLCAYGCLGIMSVYAETRYRTPLRSFVFTSC